MFATGFARTTTSMSSGSPSTSDARIRAVPGVGPATNVAVPAAGLGFVIDAPVTFVTSVYVTPEPPTEESGYDSPVHASPQWSRPIDASNGDTTSAYVAPSVRGVDAESLTDTPNVNVPSVVGVPEIVPVEERPRPGGRLEPSARVQT